MLCSTSTCRSRYRYQYDISMIANNYFLPSDDDDLSAIGGVRGAGYVEDIRSEFFINKRCVRARLCVCVCMCICVSISACEYVPAAEQSANSIDPTVEYRRGHDRKTRERKDKSDRTRRWTKRNGTEWRRRRFGVLIRRARLTGPERVVVRSRERAGGRDGTERYWKRRKGEGRERKKEKKIKNRNKSRGGLCAISKNEKKNFNNILLHN